MEVSNITSMVRRSSCKKAKTIRAAAEKLCLLKTSQVDLVDFASDMSELFHYLELPRFLLSVSSGIEMVLTCLIGELLVVMTSVSYLDCKPV